MTAEQRAASFSWKFCPGGEGHDEGADKAMDCHKCHVECLQSAEDEALERAAKEAEKPLATCLSPEGPRCPKCEAIRFAARCIRSLKSTGGTR